MQSCGYLDEPSLDVAVVPLGVSLDELLVALLVKVILPRSMQGWLCILLICVTVMCCCDIPNGAVRCVCSVFALCYALCSALLSVLCSLCSVLCALCLCLLPILPLLVVHVLLDGVSWGTVGRHLLHSLHTPSRNFHQKSLATWHLFNRSWEISNRD